MKKVAITTPLVLAFLSGCGGGGSGSSSSGGFTGQTYNWQVIHLETTSAENIEEGCIIFGTSENDTDKVITASVANTNYNILFHDSNGSLLEDYTIAAEDVASTGIVSIDSSLLPDNGYITLEEIESGLSDNPNVYMFSVEKSLLSDLVVNVRLPQTGSDCYTGEDYRANSEISDSAALSVLEQANINFYQTSYSEELVSGKSISSNIPVLSPIPAEKDTLVTAFYESENNQYTDLGYYTFVDSSYIYDTELAAEIISSNLQNTDLTPFYWQTSDNITLNSSSAITIIFNENTYLWQYIYNDTDQVTLAINDNDISSWAGFFSGSENTTQWQFDSFQTITNNTTNIELDIPELNSIENMQLIENCSIDTGSADYCIDRGASFDPDDFNFQRTHIRLLSGASNNTVYQTIYGSPSLQQPLLESSVLDIQPSATSRIEIGLMQGNSTDENLQYFMDKYLDVTTLAETSTVANFNDANGFVTTPLESEALHQAILESNVTFVQHGVE
ncbi:hypothetical protein [Paraglaciecola sp.]|uniref:hypothetical protein n=1 Tax=Paraglaciecola sp. TaxID=1920173 RepID=UPI0032664606